jgi:hypothetical protein
MDDDRKRFTNHDLHLSGQGKEVLSKLKSILHIFSSGTENRSPNNFKLKSHQNLTILLNQVKDINRTSIRKTLSMKLMINHGP